jgi:Flp pilus assembly protein CpaB
MRNNGSDFDSDEFINGVDDLFDEPVIEEKSKKGKGRKGRSSKRGDSAPKRSLAPFRFGIIASILVFLFALIFMGGESGKYVVVTKYPLTPLSKITPENIEAISLPENALVKGAISAASADEAVEKALKEITGDSLYPIGAKTQITSEMFSVLTKDGGGYLNPGERIISISADIANAANGNLRPGDIVDIVSAVANGNGLVLVSTIAQSIPIVSVGVSEQQIKNVADSQIGENKLKTPAELLPTNPLPGIYVLKVKEDIVTRILAADAGQKLGSAKVYLVYKGSDTSSITGVGTVDLLSILCENPANSRFACTS